MDYELEVFEVYDDNTEQNASKKHLKHTRKKCKQKKLTTSCSNNIRLENENEINRSKTSVVSSSEHNRPLSITESILNVFSKIVVWRDQKRYQTTIPDKLDSPHTSKDFRKGYIPCGNYSILMHNQN